jgi:palmitoyltransferase
MQVIDRLVDSKPGRIIFSFTKYAMRIFGAFMSISALGLIVAGIVFFFYVMIPLYSDPPSLFFLFNFFAGLFVSFNLLFNFVQTVRVNPGSPAKEWSKSEDNFIEIEEGRNNAGQQLPYCNRCSSPKPPRAHHCHICDKCVSRMDHHCPWVNNCIGYQNHRYFVLFLFYLWFGCLYISATYLLVVIDILPVST